MKVFIVLSCLVALGCAAPGLIAAPFAYHHAPLAYHAAPVYAAPVAVSSQYHAQDSIGQYNYGYADHLSSKAETKSLDGVTRGAYSYVDAEGKVQKVEYTADDVNGFQVSASNLPVAPVAADVAPLEQPKPVEDTPEVAKAKEEHLAAVSEAKARIAAEAVAPVVPVAHYAAPVTTYAAAPVAHYGYAAAPAHYGYAAAPAHFGYSAYPHYAPYSNFGYQYSAAAPVYSAAAPVYSAYHPFHVASPFLPVAAPEAVASDDDTVEVKAKEE